VEVKVAGVDCTLLHFECIICYMLNLWYVNGFCHLTVTEKKGSQTVFTELYHGIVLKVQIPKSANIIDWTIFLVV